MSLLNVFLSFFVLDLVIDQSKTLNGSFDAVWIALIRETIGF
jgi:hypothetical protein